VPHGPETACTETENWRARFSRTEEQGDNARWKVSAARDGGGPLTHELNRLPGRRIPPKTRCW